MILEKPAEGCYGYRLRTNDGMEVSWLCAKGIEEHIPSFSRKKPGTRIKVTVELIPCTFDEAEEYEFMILKDYIGYQDVEIRSSDKYGEDFCHTADICRTDGIEHGHLKRTFKGLKEAKAYGLIVHY